MAKKVFSALIAFVLVLSTLTIFIVFVPSLVVAQGGGDSDLGWELLNNNKVLHVWNVHNHYYFNVSNGVQFTNHYEEYWTHNVMMLGYLTGENITDPDAWNLIYRVDQLSGFNRDVEVNETYLNATLWKDLTYADYNFRLAIRYHLGINDSDLTIIPYIKNLGKAIPYVLGFGWEVKDIKIGGIEHNNSIYINETTYLLNQTLDEKYTNLTRVVKLWNETSQQDENVTIPNTIYKLYGAHQHQELYLKWNSTLKYLVWVKSRTGQYNAPVSLFLKIGTLGVGQERQTTMHWLDSTINLIPDRDGIAQQWAPNLPLPHWVMVSDPVGIPDEDTTYVFVTPTPLEECFNHVTSVLLIGTTISNVRIVVRMKYSSVGLNPMAAVNIGVRVGPARYGQVFNSALGPNYFDHIGDWANNPAPPGNPWTKSDIDNLESSLLSVFTQDAQIRCTQVYFIVTYTNPPTQTGESPTNGSTGISTTPPLYVICNDDDIGDTLTATWRSNSSGPWVDFATNTSILPATNITQTNSNFSAYSTMYYWSVNLTDGIAWCNETYHFTTESISIVFDINRSSFGFGVVQADTMEYSNTTGGADTFRIYNNGSASIDIDVNGTNATATGVTDWNLSSSNGDNQYKTEIYNSSTGWIQVNKTADTWYDNLAQSTNITANIRITTPTTFYSGKQMTCTIYMTASIH